MFLLILVGLDPLLVGLPAGLGAIAARIGVLSHFESLGRGVVDLRDVVYFVSLAGVFLALAYGALLSRKLAPGAGSRRLKLGVGLLVVSLIVVNLLGSYIGGRLDLTPGNSYTLSPATGRIVRNLDDLVTVKVFASEELPTEVALMKRDVDDLLRDLRSAGPRPGPHHRAGPDRRRRGPTRRRVARHPAGAVQRDRAGGAAGEAGLPGARDPARRRRPRPSRSSSAPTTSSTGWSRPSAS